MTKQSIVTSLLLLLAASGCVSQGSCGPPSIDWLRGAPLATRNADGDPTVEVRGRAPDSGCENIGDRTLVVVTPAEIVIREGADEELPGPLPVALGGAYDYEDERVVVDLSWVPDFVAISIREGESERVVECDAAIEGVPVCTLRE